MTIPIRDRRNVPVDTVRKPERLPPAEIREALKAVVQVNLGVAPDDAIVEVARLLGYSATSQQLRQVIEREIDALCRVQSLDVRNGKLYLAGAASIEGNATRSTGGGSA